MTRKFQKKSKKFKFQIEFYIKQISVEKYSKRKLPASEDFHFLVVDQILYEAIQNMMTPGIS